MLGFDLEKLSLSQLDTLLVIQQQMLSAVQDARVSATHLQNSPICSCDIGLSEPFNRSIRKSNWQQQQSRTRLFGQNKSQQLYKV